MVTQDFTVQPVKKLFFRFLIPSICGTMVTSIYVLADTIIVGKGLGAVAIAAMNIALPIYNFFYGMGLLFGVGGSVLMSICRGRGEDEKANCFYSLSLLLTVAAWLLSQVFCLVFMEDIARFLGATKETLFYVMDYIKYLIWGMGAYFLSAFLQTFIRNDGAPKIAMYGVIAGGVTNILLDYLFVFPMGMGMAGAALATVAGSCLTVLILVSHFFTRKNKLHFTLKNFRPGDIRHIFVHGTASFLIEISAGITIFAFNLQLLKYIGNVGITVYGIICNTAIVVMSLCKGVNQAAQPIISTNHGAGKQQRSTKVRALSIRTSLVICAVPTLLGLAVPDLFTVIFLNPDAAVLAHSGTAIRIYFTGFMCMAVNMVFICYFQAVAKAGKALLLCLLRGCVLILLFVRLLPVLFGTAGIWAAFPAAELLTLLAGLALLWHDRSVSKKGQPF